MPGLARTPYLKSQRLLASVVVVILLLFLKPIPVFLHYLYFSNLFNCFLYISLIYSNLFEISRLVAITLLIAPVICFHFSAGSFNHY